MREIKFRAIVPVNTNEPKRMMHYDLSRIDDLNRLAAEDWDINQLMQFTGLKDKNGKEIWEGDILKVDEKNGKGEFPYDGEFKERIVKVIWSDFRASWTLKFNEMANNDLFRYTQYGNWVEVIGNIYEHSHLLESK